MTVRSRLQVLERCQRPRTFLLCPQCRYTFPLEQPPALLGRELMRMERERNCLESRRPIAHAAANGVAAGEG
jgi:hypothetical protein